MRREELGALDNSRAWGLYNCTPTSEAIFIPIPGVGLGLRRHTQFARGHAYSHDRAGNGIWAKGLAVQLSEADVRRFGADLRCQGVEVFTDSTLPDLVIRDTGNGAPAAAPAVHRAPPRVDLVRAPGCIEPRTWRKRGVHMAEDMIEAMRQHAEQKGLQIREVLDQVLRNFLEGFAVNRCAERETATRGEPGRRLKLETSSIGHNHHDAILDHLRQS